jgi:hypothetical protein
MSAPTPKRTNPSKRWKNPFAASGLTWTERSAVIQMRIALTATAIGTHESTTAARSSQWRFQNRQPSRATLTSETSERTPLHWSTIWRLEIPGTWIRLPCKLASRPERSASPVASTVAWRLSGIVTPTSTRHGIGHMRQSTKSGARSALSPSQE